MGSSQKVLNNLYQYKVTKNPFGIAVTDNGYPPFVLEIRFDRKTLITKYANELIYTKLTDEKLLYIQIRFL